MTTIWRPHPLVKHIEPVEEEVPDDDVPDVKVEPVADDDGINGERKKDRSRGEGREAEERPLHKGAMRARGEASLEVQGVQRLSARSSAPSLQGVRWGFNLRARSCALYMQGVRWVCNLRARSYTLCVQGVRWGINLRAWSSAL